MQLIIENLTKTYANGVQALKNVSLTLGKGMFGLLGPNGAGKSSLMRTIATLQEADSGTIRFGEIDVLKEKDKVRRLLGYLPQEFGVYPKVDAVTLLDHLAVLKGITNKAERKERVAALLHKTNLYEARKKNLGGYSGGMKQRFGIAQALLADPQLIIVDEPTAGLDPAERNRFHNLLSEIGENTVVILSTHIVEDVRELCTDMAIINKGTLLLQTDPSKALETIKGQIWQKRISRDQIPSYKARLNVISDRMIAGKPVIHVWSEAEPEEGFTQIEPDLEDVYFYEIFGKKQVF
ncbi:ABC transporter ATP-binding protein [Hugenholtzia roseola]|uniref:ABC transporter ATP-binding protein n=1 Tax=Hugenholtzia roseola TaxID=1002 RepID=UPI0003F86E87|nr:ABC transporter ATP-binding protein [Hugenholtzia roseola]